MKKTTVICPQCKRILWTLLIVSLPDGKHDMIAVCMGCKNELRFEVVLAEGAAA